MAPSRTARGESPAIPDFIGLDVGGTFTDTVLLQVDGSIPLGKALSTPEDFSLGALRSLESAAEAIGHRLGGLLAGARMPLRGTTAAENAIVTGQRAQVDADKNAVMEFQESVR